MPNQNQPQTEDYSAITVQIDGQQKRLEDELRSARFADAEKTANEMCRLTTRLADWLRDHRLSLAQGASS